jgi:hypothetical protein
LAAVIFLLPIAIYLWHFGWRISDSHVRWSEFGSAMSGIYAPALTLATLAVLLLQVRLQGEMHRHEKDQAYVQQARADVEFYVQRLDAALAGQVAQGNTVRDVLHGQFQPSSAPEFDSERLRILAKEIDMAFPQVLALVFAIQAILAGLSATQEVVYRLNFTSATQKLIAVLSFETCVALEHYHRTRTENRLKTGKYYFSPQLSAP